jgi:hypothetical protein
MKMKDIQVGQQYRRTGGAFSHTVVVVEKEVFPREREWRYGIQRRRTHVIISAPNNPNWTTRVPASQIFEEEN